MLMLAGMMGLMLVGATAIIGIEGEEEADDTASGPEEEAPRPFTDLHDLIAGEIRAGTGDADEIAGTDGADQLGGYSGDDVMAGAAGDDMMRGDDGADRMTGDAGDDEIHGGDGDDLIYGSSGDDALFGHMGRDLMRGGAGADVMHGGAGDDTLSGGSGEDAVHGGLDNDVLTGGAGGDTLFGSSGDDWITGFTARLDGSEGDDGAPDFLNGGDGSDTLLAGAGDTLTLGAGADFAVAGDWIGSAEDPAELIDFLTGEDQLILVLNKDAGADHDVTIDDSGTVTRIVLDGVVVATLPGGTPIGMSDIALLPESDAAGFLRPGS